MNCATFRLVKSLAFLAFSAVWVSAETAPLSQIPIPGVPNGDAVTEMLQSREACRSMEVSLTKIQSDFPDLATQSLTAYAAWRASPFAAGYRAIDAEIKENGSKEFLENLQKTDKKLNETLAILRPFKTEQEASNFLVLVAKRAKAGIELPMVSATLLWNYPPYKAEPSGEFSDGYTNSIIHSTKAPISVKFAVPMSWKQSISENPELMIFFDRYGHGRIWITVLVRQELMTDGTPASEDLAFAAATRESIEAQYTDMGIKLSSFRKTKLNGMPALMMTREQTHEQLGKKATRAASVIRAFKGNYHVNFQINTLGSEDTDEASEYILRHQELFQMLAASLQIK